MRSVLASLLLLATACGGAVTPPQPENVAPRARLSGPLYAPLGTAVVFDAAESFDADGTITEYTFHFSDGSRARTQVMPEIEHTFAADGAYEVAVVVKDSAGALASARLLVVVRSDPPTCATTSDCPLGADCRAPLCYTVEAGSTGSNTVDCQSDGDCGPGLLCRAGLCLTDPDIVVP